MAMIARRFSRRIATVGLRTPAIREVAERSRGAHSELLTTARAGVSLRRPTSVISVAHFHGLADRAAPGSELRQGMRSLSLSHLNVYLGAYI